MQKAVLLGLAKLLEKDGKKARPGVRAGEYEIDEEILIRLVGTLNVGEDHTYTPTVSMPWKTVLALFTRYCGITREAALGHLEAAMKAALAEGENAAELLAAVADLEEAEARVQESLDELPQMVRKGAVSTKELQYAEIRPTAKKARKVA
jgi:hypothetical protein